MRILFLHDKYVENGGAERCISIKRDELEREKHKTFLFTSTEKEDLRIKDSKILRFRTNRFFGSYIQMIYVYFKLRKYIKKIQPDLIFIQNNHEFPYPFLKACKGYKTIQRVHDYGIICPTGWCVYKDNLEICDGKMGIKCLKHKCVSLPVFLSYFLKLQYIKRSRTVKEYLAPSKTLRNYMLNSGFKHVSFVRYPLEIEDGKENIKRERNLFIYIGGLYEHKGIHLLIEAFKELVKTKPSAKLEIIGLGPEEYSLKRIVRKYNLDANISFLGKVEHSRLYKYYKKAAAVIVPSIWIENSPYVVLESLHFKAPVIGSDIGGIKEQITDSKKGILFERNNKRDLISKILSKLNGKIENET